MRASSGFIRCLISFLFLFFQTHPAILKTTCATGLSQNRTTLTGNANKEELLLLLQVHLVDKEIPVCVYVYICVCV